MISILVLLGLIQVLLPAFSSGILLQLLLNTNVEDKKLIGLCLITIVFNIVISVQSFIKLIQFLEPFI